MMKECAIILALFIGLGLGWILRGNQVSKPEYVDTVINVRAYWDGKKFQCVQEKRPIKAGIDR